MTAKQHIIHGRDHEYGGADPFGIIWEDIQDCLLLGSADGDLTLTITLDQDAPTTGVLHVVCATVELGLPHGVNNGETFPNGCTDSSGAGWNIASATLPLIGLTRQSIPDTGFADQSLQVGSVARAVSAGNLAAGDTVTVTFEPSTGATVSSTGLLVWTATTFETIGQTANFGPGPLYDNGDTYPGFGTDPTGLSWEADKDASFLVVPDADAHMITAFAAYPAQSGFAPLVGGLVGERSSGDCSIACACMTVATTDSVDPGGSWVGAASALTGNYQLDTGGA